MKTTNFIKRRYEKLTLLIIMLFCSIVAFAQEATETVQQSVTTSTTTEEWVTNPLYWVIGALVLIVIIALVARSGRKN